jgi:hypothetical protein
MNPLGESECTQVKAGRVADWIEAGTEIARHGWHCYGPKEHYPKKGKPLI